MSWARLTALGALCTIALRAEASLACDLAEPASFEIEPDGDDVTAPLAPRARVDDIRHGRDAGCFRGSCKDLTYVEFVVGPAEGAADEELGFLFEAEGDPFYVPGGPIAVGDAGRARLYFNGSDEADGPDVDVSVFAVDRAGNVSAVGTTVRVRRSEGCRLASDSLNGAAWSLAALALLVRRNRRSPKPREC